MAQEEEEGSSKPRSVLGDITNRVHKRASNKYDVVVLAGKQPHLPPPPKANVLDLAEASKGVCADDKFCEGNGLPNFDDGFVNQKHGLIGFEGENKRPRLAQAVGENIVDLELCGGGSDLRAVSEKDGDKLVLSQTGSIGCTFFSESQVVEFGSQVGGNDCAYVSGKTDSIKDCRCSFCTKAGYMLLDLNYQDIRARVTATRKSQKEASLLAEKSRRGNQATEKHISGNSNELESQLMYQWRSLFQHMANQCEQESNQLEASLLTLSGLKEKCKTQMLSTIITDKH